MKKERMWYLMQSHYNEELEKLRNVILPPQVEYKANALILSYLKPVRELESVSEFESRKLD